MSELRKCLTCPTGTTYKDICPLCYKETVPYDYYLKNKSTQVDELKKDVIHVQQSYNKLKWKLEDIKRYLEGLHIMNCGECGSNYDYDDIKKVIQKIDEALK